MEPLSVHRRYLLAETYAACCVRGDSRVYQLLLPLGANLRAFKAHSIQLQLYPMLTYTYYQKPDILALKAQMQW